MAEYVMQYSISGDITAQLLECSRLHSAIDADGGVSTAVCGVSGKSDTLRIVFESEPTTEEKAVIDALVSGHSGRSLCPFGKVRLTEDKAQSSYTRMSELISKDITTTAVSASLSISLFAHISADQGECNARFAIFVDGVEAMSEGTIVYVHGSNSPGSLVTLFGCAMGITPGDHTVTVKWVLHDALERTLQCYPVSSDYDFAVLTVEEES